MTTNLLLPLMKASTIGMSILAAGYVFRYRSHWIPEITGGIGRLAGRGALCFGFLTLAPILIRLMVLPWWPAPLPQVHDEFSHLLAADTLGSGRATNPPHAFWRHLETNYVLSVPTYTSKYQPGIGASMALGKRLTGHPWAGVLLVTGLFCGATYWMLLGWLPAHWALVGGVLATINFGVFHPWVESYWGGGVAALGGAVMFGALARLWQSAAPRYAVILVAAWGLVWFTRPYEAAICAILLVPLIVYPFRQRSLAAMATALAPAVTTGLVVAALFFYYNWRVTGSSWVMPYQLYQKQYGVPQNFLWQPLVTGPIPDKKNMADIYEWQKERYLENKTPVSFIRTSAQYLNRLWVFYGGYVGRGIPLLLLLWPPLWRTDRRIPLLLGMLAAAYAASLLYPFRQPQYLAHYASLWLLLILLALRTLWRWRWRTHPVGAVVVTALLSTSWLQKLQATDPVEYPWHVARAAIQSTLEKTADKHLILVHYSSTHNPFQEWVYNAADIDNSPVVWAQPIDAASDAALIRYFAGRKVWSLQADDSNRKLTPLQ